MKKFFVVFALFCVMIFAVSCGGSGSSSKSASNGCSTYKEYECRGDASYFCGYAEDGSLKWYFHKACESGCDAAAGKCNPDSDGNDSGTPDTDKPDTTPEQPDENDPASDSSDSEPDNGDTDTSTPDDNTDSTPDEGDSQDDNGNSTPDNDYSVPDDGDSGTNDNDTDTGTAEPTEEEKCYAAGGSWDVFANNEMEKCYKIVDCAPKPEYTEWRDEQSWVEYYDLEDDQWTHFGQNYNTEYNDSGEPQPCQYVCAENALREDNKCKPYCSAVFNGESSRIEVANNDLLNPGSDSWTIEAWIKQDEGDLTSDYAPILRKGTSENPSYVLMGYRKQQSWSSVTYTVTGATTYKSAYGSTTENLQVDGTFNEFSGGWTHVALVHNKKVEGGALIQSTTYKITLYVNGKQVNSKTYEPRTSMNLLEVNEPLVIGANLYTSWSVSKKYFKGLIDSIRISGSEKYTADFTPSKLSADNDTVAFWDFSGNANDSSGHGLHGTATKISYSTDCK